MSDLKRETKKVFLYFIVSSTHVAGGWSSLVEGDEGSYVPKW